MNNVAMQKKCTVRHVVECEANLGRDAVFRYGKTMFKRPVLCFAEIDESVALLATMICMHQGHVHELDGMGSSKVRG